LFLEGKVADIGESMKKKKKEGKKKKSTSAREISSCFAFSSGVAGVVAGRAGMRVLRHHQREKLQNYFFTDWNVGALQVGGGNYCGSTGIVAGLARFHR